MLVWFVAHVKRTQAAYINPESLVWKDAGALIMMFQLVATAFDIKSCPVGTLGEPIPSEMFGGAKIISAGECLSGNRSFIFVFNFWSKYFYEFKPNFKPKYILTFLVSFVKQFANRRLQRWLQ